MARDLYTGRDTVVVVENSSVAYISRPFELASGHVCWAGGLGCLPASVCACWNISIFHMVGSVWFSVACHASEQPLFAAATPVVHCIPTFCPATTVSLIIITGINIAHKGMLAVSTFHNADILGPSPAVLQVHWPWHRDSMLTLERFGILPRIPFPNDRFNMTQSSITCK